MGKKTTFAKSLAVTGILAGLAIAIVVPFMAFVAAKFEFIPSGGAIAIAIISVIAGAPIVLISAFFGIVIPSSVERSDDTTRQFSRNEKREDKEGQQGAGNNVQ